MKQELSQYFDNLSEKQREILQDGLSSQKQLFFWYLQELRNRTDIEPTLIKSSYLKYKKMKRNTSEFGEEAKKEEELENLLQELEIIY